MARGSQTLTPTAPIYILKIILGVLHGLARTMAHRSIRRQSMFCCAPSPSTAPRRH